MNRYQVGRRIVNRELLKSDFVAEGGHQREPEGHYEKSIIHVRVPPGEVPQAPSPRACRFH
jgi:hypothetical protein